MIKIQRRDRPTDRAAMLVYSWCTVLVVAVSESYVQTLSTEAKVRYEDKIRLIDGVDRTLANWGEKVMIFLLWMLQICCHILCYKPTTYCHSSLNYSLIIIFNIIVM